jgi:hypothetical protein
MVIAKGALDINAQILVRNLKYMFCLEDSEEKFALVVSK